MALEMETSFDHQCCAVNVDAFEAIGDHKVVVNSRGRVFTVMEEGDVCFESPVATDACDIPGFIEFGKSKTGETLYLCRTHADVLTNYKKVIQTGEQYDAHQSMPAFNVDVVYPDGTVVPGRHDLVSGGRPTQSRCVKNGTFIGGAVRRTNGNYSSGE